MRGLISIEAHRVLDYVFRTCLDDLVYPADVFADEPYADDRNADEEEENGEQRKQPLRLRAEEKPPEQQYRNQRERPEAGYEPSYGENLQRHERKARYEVEVQADQFVEAVFGLPREPLGVLDLHLRRVRREGVGERGNEERSLVRAYYAVHYLPPVRAQHAARRRLHRQVVARVQCAPVENFKKPGDGADITDL